MSAVISDCGQYRYRLERAVGVQGPVYAFFGVNPSTADASLDDQTVRKWIGFSKIWGASGFIVGNVFAYRATDVNELRVAADPIGPLNRTHLKRIAADADILVPCWGAQRKVPSEMRGHFARTLDLLKSTGKPVRHLGLTACGQPKHPLMLAYETELIDFDSDRVEREKRLVRALLLMLPGMQANWELSRRQHLPFADRMHWLALQRANSANAREAANWLDLMDREYAKENALRQRTGAKDE